MATSNSRRFCKPKPWYGSQKGPRPRKVFTNFEVWFEFGLTGSDWTPKVAWVTIPTRKQPSEIDLCSVSHVLRLNESSNWLYFSICKKGRLGPRYGQVFVGLEFSIVEFEGCLVAGLPLRHDLVLEQWHQTQLCWLRRFSSQLIATPFLSLSFVRVYAQGFVEQNVHRKSVLICFLAADP